MIDQNRVIKEDIVQTPEGASVVHSEHSTTVVPGATERRSAQLLQVQRISSFVVGLIAAIILIRFVLLLLGANADNAFAHFIYSISYPFVAVFLGLFGHQVQYGQSLFEFEDVIAIAVYAFIG